MFFYGLVLILYRCSIGTVSIQYPVSVYGFWGSCFKLLASSFGLPAPGSGFWLPAFGFRFWLWASGFRLPASGARLPAFSFLSGQTAQA